MYLKSRGIDPKTHRVVAELVRAFSCMRLAQIIQRMLNPRNASDNTLTRLNMQKNPIKKVCVNMFPSQSVSDKRATGKMGIDKAAAGRFIKHAIAQAKNAELVDEPSHAASAAASSSASHERVPVKITSKMAARAAYEKELKELGSEEEDLEVFDEGMADEDEDATGDPPEETTSVGLDKGKARASDYETSKDEEASSRRKRPRIDPFSGKSPCISSKIDQALMIYWRVRKSVHFRVDIPNNRSYQEGKAFHPGASIIGRHFFKRGLCLGIRRSRREKSCKKGKAKSEKIMNCDHRRTPRSFLLHGYTLISVKYTDVDHSTLLACSAEV